jgi:signal transduction histidine kinase
VRRRLVLAIAGVATAAVVLFAIPLGVVLQRSHRDQELLRLQRDAVAATRTIDLSAVAGDRVELPRSPDALAVYDRSGRRVAGRGPARADALVRTVLRRGRLASATGENRLTAAVPLLQGERVVGVVRASRGDAAVADKDRRSWLELGGLALGVVAFACAAALVLGRRLATPLERLAQAAGRLGSGDFGVRAPRAGVAEVDAVGDALDASAERLQALVTRERAFTADASHQLRTPLAALKLELEAMELRGDSSAESAAALAQVARLQATVDTLLAVARDAPRRAETADVVSLFDELGERWRGTLAEQARPLRVETPPARWQLNASGPVALEILEVLIDNACRHGGGQVTLRAREVQDWIAIDVEDEGEGFSGDPAEAFERRSGTDGGAGIGLALARSLAAAEAGSLSVSRPRPRPVLTLLLPRAQ